MKINLNRMWKIRLARWVLDRIDWKWLETYFHDRRSREEMADFKRGWEIEKVAKKEMDEFIDSKGAEFKKELKVSPIVNMVPLHIQQPYRTSQVPTLDQVRKVTQSLVESETNKSVKKKAKRVVRVVPKSNGAIANAAQK